MVSLSCAQNTFLKCELKIFMSFFFKLMLNFSPDLTRLFKSSKYKAIGYKEPASIYRSKDLHREVEFSMEIHEFCQTCLETNRL